MCVATKWVASTWTDYRVGRQYTLPVIHGLIIEWAVHTASGTWTDYRVGSTHCQWYMD